MDSFFTPDLTNTAILIGAAILASHLFGLMSADLCMTMAKSFPRSRIWGTILLVVTVIWLLIVAVTTDLGEFSPMRNLVVIAIVVGAALFWKFVPDFLSSRSLGFLLLLAAHPVLEVTFLKHGVLHYTLAILAYCWALVGLFLVGMPYLHRDLIGWICMAKWRWDLACWGGVLFGAALMIDGLRLAILG